MPTDPKDLKKMTKAELISKITRMDILLRNLDEVKPPEKVFKTPNFRGIRRFMVTEVATHEGSGTEDDPSRLVYWVYDDEGELIAVTDTSHEIHPRFRSHAESLQMEK